MTQNIREKLDDLSKDQRKRIDQFEMMQLDDFFFEMRHLEQSAQSQSSEFSSLTLADLYAQQGHITRAKAIYRRLLRQDPSNTDIQKKLDKIIDSKQTRQSTVSDSSWSDDIALKISNIESNKQQQDFLNQLMETVKTRKVKKS